MVGSGGLAAMGIWCLLFGAEGEEGRKRKKRRVSGWPFGNEEARRVREENKMEKKKGKGI